MSVNTRLGLLIIISSPSGAGKSTLAKRLLADDDKISFSVSATTRAMRPREVEGKDYYFKTRTEFQAMVAADQMLEHAEVFDNFYGSPLGPVSDAIHQGHDVLFDVPARRTTNSCVKPARKCGVCIHSAPFDHRIRSATKGTRPRQCRGCCWSHGKIARRDKPLGGIRLCSGE